MAILVHVFDPITNEDICRILAVYNSNPNSALSDIQAIQEWVKKQPHLPEIPPMEMVRNFLVLSKFSVEKTKQKIDMYYTLRSKLQGMFDVQNPNSPQMQTYVDINYLIPLPKLTEDYYRVTVFKLNSGNSDLFNPFWFFAWSLDVGHVRLLEDFAVGSEFVCDLGNCNLGHLTKTTPMLVRKATVVYEKVFTSSIKGLHFINCPPIVDTFLKILRRVASEKIVGRIYIHENLESLHEKVSRNVLPSDYGGSEKCLKELNENLKMKVADMQKEFDKVYSLQVNEKLRPNKSQYNDIFGSDGNFKQLDFD